MVAPQVPGIFVRSTVMFRNVLKSVTAPYWTVRIGRLPGMCSLVRYLVAAALGELMNTQPAFRSPLDHA